MKNMASRVIALIMVIAMVAGLFVSVIATYQMYKQRKDMQRQIDENNLQIENEEITQADENKTINILVINPDGEKAEASVSGDFTDAKDASIKGFSELSIGFEENNNMKFDSINGIENSKLGEWKMYINDTEADAPANAVVVNNNDTIKWEWIEF